MTDRILPVLAFLLLAGFLGILFIWVPRVDLGVIIGLTLLLVAIDFFFSKKF